MPVSFVEKYGSKTFEMSWAAMPHPLSATSTLTEFAFSVRKLDRDRAAFTIDCFDRVDNEICEYRTQRFAIGYHCRQRAVLNDACLNSTFVGPAFDQTQRIFSFDANVDVLQIEF